MSDNLTVHLCNRDSAEVRALAEDFGVSPDKVIEKALATYIFLVRKAKYADVDKIELHTPHKHGVYWTIKMEDLLL